MSKQRRGQKIISLGGQSYIYIYIYIYRERERERERERGARLSKSEFYVKLWEVGGIIDCRVKS